MKLRITLAVALATLSLSALTASAQEPAPAPKQPAWRTYCAPEIEKFCKEADKNNKTTECLAEHEKDLSEDCTTKFLRGYRVSQICKADFERLCKDAPALGQCIKDHDAELSKECRAALVKGSKQQRAEQKAEEKAAPAGKTAEKPAKPAKKGAKKK
jgi:hypothetical protein